MSGAVIVGDAESPATLPSESAEDPVLFSDEEGEDDDLGVYSEETDTSRLETRSMTAAAEEKDNMDRGFGE